MESTVRGVGFRGAMVPSGVGQADAGRSRHKALAQAIFGFVVLALVLVGSPAWAVDYVYDANGRLVAATNDQGESARYVYDALGNLERIDRLAPGELAVFAFSPGRGGIGTQVTIQGKGFSADPAGNLVAFNGASAEVMSATAVTLVAEVPVGATTGPISVAVGSASVATEDDFVVDASAQPPRITGFSPLIGEVGTQVTVEGEHFAPISGQTTVGVGGRVAPPSSLSDTELTFGIPAHASSGRVSVTTPHGRGVSAQDLLVLPSGVSAEGIEAVVRVVVDAPAVALSVQEAGKALAVLFDGTGGQWLSAQFTGSNEAVDYALYGTANQLLVDRTLNAGESTIHLPPLPATGTYMLLLRPQSTPVSWQLRLESDVPLDVDGDTVFVNSSVPAQSKRLYFFAGSGVNLGLGLSELGTSSEWSSMSMVITTSEGDFVAGQSCVPYYGRCQVNLSNLGAGMYALEVYPPSDGDQIMSLVVTLSSDIGGFLADGEPKMLTLGRFGQNGRFVFPVVAGEVVTVAAMQQSTNPAGQRVDYSIMGPDGALLARGDTASSMFTLNIPPAPSSGNYSFIVDPYYGAKAEVELLRVSGEWSELVMDGPYQSFETVAPGQHVFIRLEAAGGESLGLGMSYPASGMPEPGSIHVYGPSGAKLLTQHCNAGAAGCRARLPNLQAGAYKIEVHPHAYGERTMSFEAALSSEVTGQLETDVPFSLDLHRHGQNGRLRFSGEEGEVVALRVEVEPPESLVSVVETLVYRPDGVLLANGGMRGGEFIVNIPPLPVSGDYTIFMGPVYGAPMKMSLLKIHGLSGEIVVDGPMLHYATNIPGQNVYLRFDAENEDDLRINLSNLQATYYNSSNVALRVYRESGHQLLFRRCYVADGPCVINLSGLDAGPYRVVISAPESGDKLMSFDIGLTRQ